MRIKPTGLSNLVTRVQSLVAILLVCSLFASSVVYTYTRVSTPARVHAATSSTLNFQARLLGSAGNLVPDGNYTIEFNLYTASSGGSSIWTEKYQGSAFTCPVAGSSSTGNANNKVRVVNGYFSVNLGHLCTFPSTINWDQEHWLTMNVESDGEMTPRLKLTAVPYAFRAGQADRLTSGSASLAADDLLQKAPVTIQSLNSALAGLRINQIGSGGLIQLQGDSADVFTVDKQGNVVAGTINTNTFNGNTLTFGGASATTIQAANNQGLTVQSQGTGGLTLNSANGTIVLGTATTTIQKTGTSFTLDLANAGTSTFNISNSNGSNVAGLDVEGAIAAGNGNAFQVNTDGDITSVFTLLDGTDTTNGSAVIASSSLVLNDSAGFNVGNYVQVNSTDCSGAEDICYAKITAINSNTLTITPSLKWANGSTVNEYHVPEIGGTNTASTLTNRYGRGYFISGVVTGNGTTYLNENNLETSLDAYNVEFNSSSDTALTINNLGSGAANLNLIDGGLQIGGTPVITNGRALQNLTGLTVASGGASITGGIDNNSGGITEAGAIAGASTINASGLITSVGLNAGTGLIQGTGGLTITGAVSLDGALSDPNSNLVLDDTVDLGSAANGLRVNTDGSILDINGDLVLDDQLALGSASTGLLITTDGVITDIDDSAIAFGENITGTGALGISSAAASGLTLNSGTDGTISIGDDGSAETINIGTGAAAKTIVLGAVAQATTLDLNTGVTTTDAFEIAANSLTTGIGQEIIVNGLTTGNGLRVSSSATSTNFDGELVEIVMSGSNANNDGMALRVEYAATSDGTAVMFTNAGAGLAFRVNDDGTDGDTTPFVIDANGNIGIGTTTLGDKVEVVGTIDATTGYKFNNTAGITLDCAANQFMGNATSSGGILTAGTCENDDTGISDIAFKENITLKGSVLDGLKNIAVVNYNYRQDVPGYDFTTEEQTGVIAQQLETIFPELVHTGPDGYKRVSFRSLNFYTLQAVIELSQKLNTSGDATLNSVSTGGTLRLSSSGSLLNINGLSVISGGASITGGLDNNSGGITETGAISGVSSYAQASGNFSQSGSGTFNTGTGTVSLNGAVTAGSTLTATGLATFNGNMTLQTGDTFTINAEGFTDLTGNGLTRTGSALTLGLQTGSGMAVSASGLSNRRDCSNNQILKWATGGGGAWNCAADGVSDERLKKNIVTVEDEMLSRIKDVRVVEFDYDCENPAFQTMHCDTDHQTGVIAQELAQIFPELVTEVSGHYEVNYDALNLYNLKAIAEIARSIDSNGNGKLNSLTVNGVLEAGTIRADHIEGLDYLGRFESLESRVSTLEQQPNNGSGSSIDLNNLTVGNFTATGTARFTSDTETQKLTVNLDFITKGAMVVEGPATFKEATLFEKDTQFNGQINVLGYANVQGLTVNLDLIVRGAMQIDGPVTFKEAARFEKNATFEGDVAVKGQATFNNDTAGQATVKQGETVVKVEFKKPKTAKPVITLTLGDGKFAQYSYRNVTETSFEIVLLAPAPEDLIFSWVALSTEQQAVAPPAP